MGDLISRSALMECFCVNQDGKRIPETDCDNFPVTLSIKDIKRIIREQPVAFDVEKVVEQIEEYRDDFMDDIYEELQDDSDNCRANRIIDRFDEAMGIVRNGGGRWKIEDYTIEMCPWCETEQVIFSHGVTGCPNCGKPLAPCSVCTEENGGCDYDKCPYGCDGSENDGKKPITNRAITEEERKLYEFL